MLVGGLGPLQHEVEPHPIVFVQDEDGVVHRLCAPHGDDFLQVIDNAVGMFEHEPFLRRLVLEDDPHALVQVADHLQPFLDDGRVELDFRKDRRVGMEVDPGAGAARGSDLLEGTDRLALFEAHFPLGAIAFHGGHEILRERVHDAGPDTVETAGRLVAAALELATGVQHREDDLERALAGRCVGVDRNAATVVFDRD